MKKTYLLASVAIIFVSEFAMASNSEDLVKEIFQEEDPTLRQKLIGQLSGRRNLEKDVLPSAGEQFAAAASESSTQLKADALVLHERMPKTATTGKIMLDIIHTLEKRAAIFLEIQSRTGERAGKPEKDFEVRLEENMGTLVSLQQKYLVEVQGLAGLIQQNYAKAVTGFESMNEKMARQYVELLKAVK